MPVLFCAVGDSPEEKGKEGGGTRGLLSCIGGVGGVSITIWLLFFVFLEPYDPSKLSGRWCEHIIWGKGGGGVTPILMCFRPDQTFDPKFGGVVISPPSFLAVLIEAAASSCLFLLQLSPEGVNF